MHPEAEQLNGTIGNNNPVVLSMLSTRGKDIYFPKKGILGQTAEAKGKKINATIGMALEDDGSPLCLQTIASQVKLPKENVFLYSSSYGNLALRKKWQQLIFAKNPSLKTKPISLPVVTCALTHGLSIAAYLFGNDEIIIPEPFWGNYRLIFTNTFGTKIKTFPLFEGSRLNTKELAKILANDLSMVLLNYPNNPTGYTPTEKEADELVQIIHKAAMQGHKIIILIDDAYFGLVYEQGIFQESLFAKLADLHKNVLAVKIDGATKEDYVWGLRVGFVTFGIKGGSPKLYEALEAKAAGAVRGTISNAPNISQSLVLHSLEDPNYTKQKKEKYETLKRRYIKVKEIIATHKEYQPYFTPLPFNSGYFMCIEVKESETVRKILLEKFDTGIIALPGIIRIAFSGTPYDQLEELFENIYKACKLINKAK